MCEGSGDVGGGGFNSASNVGPDEDPGNTSVNYGGPSSSGGGRGGGPGVSGPTGGPADYGDPGYGHNAPGPDPSGGYSDPDAFAHSLNMVGAGMNPESSMQRGFAHAIEAFGLPLDGQISAPGLFAAMAFPAFAALGMGTGLAANWAWGEMDDPDSAMPWSDETEEELGYARDDRADLDYSQNY